MPTLDSQVLKEEPIGLTYANLSPLSEDVSGLFKPYASDAFMNYTDLYLDNSFFIFAPEEFRSYLWRIVQRNLWWFRGFVPGLHNQGVLSSHMGSRVCKRVSELTMAGGFRVEGYEKGEKFLEKFIKENFIKLKLTRSLPELNAIGNVLGKIDFKANGGVTIKFIPGNKYFAYVDSDQSISQFIALVEYIPAEASIDIKTTTKNDEGYYLVEQRKMEGTKCYQRYAVYRATAAMTTSSFMPPDEVSYEALSNRIKSKIARIIGDDKLGSAYELPFKNNIGAAVILNSPSTTGISLNGFSDSTLQDCHSSLFQFDVTNTQKEGNKWFAQTGVLIPDNMIPPEITNNPNGNVQASYLRNQAKLDGRVYKKVASVDQRGEAQKPVFFQADNQSASYNEDLKHIEADIATLCGMTPTALAGNLTSNGNRTATEVLDEDEITRATIEMKRDLIREPMTQLFKWVLEFYEVRDDKGNDDIDMVFNSSILNNPERETKDILDQVNGGIMSSKTGIARKNRSYSKKEVEEEYKAIQDENAIKIQSGVDGLWTGI